MRFFGLDRKRILFVFLMLAVSSIGARGQDSAPDLAVTKTHSGNFTVGQVGATYTIVVRNIGRAATTEPIVVNDQLPVGLSAVSISGEGWSCTQPVGPCQRTDSLGPRQSFSALVLTVNVTRKTPDTVVNTATVSGDGNSFQGNNVSEDPTEILAGSPDLNITKRHAGTFTPGQTGATYQIQVSNVGQGATNGAVTVTDTLPAALTATSIGGIGWGCTQPAGPCTRTDVLPAGTTYPIITLTVNVAANATGQITNTAKVANAGDTNPANDTATDVSSVATSATPDVRVRKTHSGNFSAGQNGAVYTIVVDNPGQAPTTGAVTVTDILPDGLTPASMTGTGWNCTQPGGPCTRTDALQAGAAYLPITFLVNVGANATGAVTNVATVTTPGDTNSNNDAVADPTNIQAPAPDLKITKTHIGNFFAGQTGTYTIQVENVGLAPAVGAVTVVDNPPASLTITAMNGTGWSCTQPAGPCTRGNTLGVGAAYPAITVTVSVANNAPATVTNNASVSGGGDTNPNNNAVSDPTSVGGITGCPAPESPHPYSNNFDFTWTCPVAGNPASVDVAFDALTFVEAGDFIYVMDGNGNNIPGSPFTGAALAGRTVNVPGATVKIRLTSDAAGQGYGLKVTSLTPVVTPTASDLTISKSHTGDFYQAQVGAQYSIVVRNIGASPSAGVVTVNDVVPAGLSATGISGAGWTCTQPAGPCTRGDALAPNASYPALTLTANVAVNAPAALANTANVSGGNDSVPGNNSSSNPTTILVPTATCQGPQGPLPQGNLPESTHPYDNDVNLRWTCVQQGNPAGIAVSFDNLTLIDGSDFVSITDKNGNPIPGSPFTEDSLANRTINLPGDTVIITLVSDSRRNARGFKVTSIVSLGSPDPDLTLTKTHNGNFTQGQNGAVYLIVVRNIGGGPGNGQVTVTDNLPPGLIATGINGPGWNCGQPSGPCSRADGLPSGGSYPPLTLTVNVAGNATSPVTNTATVAGGGDTNGGNNNAGDPTIIEAVTPITCVLPESPHPYANGSDITYTCSITGNPASLNVTFDAQTALVDGDLLYVQNVNGVNIPGSPFTGVTLAGQTVNVPGSVVKIRLVSDDRRVAYGFKVNSVVGGN